MAALATLKIEDFCSNAANPEFIKKLCKDFALTFPDSKLSESEIRSWRNSLPELAKLLQQQQPPLRGHILIEYPMPIGSERADCILVGESEAGPEIIVIELKQWTQGSVTLHGKHGVTWLEVAATDPYTSKHPCEQVNIYRSALEHALNFGDFKPIINTLVFLHNYQEKPKEEVLRANEFSSHVNSSLLRSLNHGELDAALLLSRLKRPTQALAHLTSPQRKYSDAFILNFSEKLNCSDLFKATGQQTHAFKRIAPLVQQAQTNTCVIIHGLVGTGKTVLAMKLVQHLMKLGKNPKYYVKSAAIGQCIKGLDFAVNGKAVTPYLVVDEAHRLTKATAAGLMDNKHLIVFFIDDSQWISPEENCRSDDIQQMAHARGYHVITHVLDEQLRCRGANSYVDWVYDLVFGAATQAYSSVPEFSVQVAESPQAMEDHLRAQARGNASGRIVAGYCWHWQTERTPGVGTDIHIGPWQARWNQKMAFKEWNQLVGYHEEVGAIYTVQGFEYDYVGVILGPDIVLRNGRIEIEPSCNADKRLSNMRTDPAVRKQVIRNIYYVLLTRARRGVVLYAVDPALQQFMLTNITAKVRGH
ncbi:hypothetical protein PF66_01860 [Pseudomonas asplenii]|uniref:Schlafen group 3-like DNA/RNA helicase domain-containing protein n=1 Tax=Pseudomonas asplenii TaxID=53407 RepID=A0A0N0E4R8_9PSED|nr:DNA/RNA helicase domain-containing protein [Pseudomonas fuscovaginae]KPA91577.1 hypothetical protein PF66_01860 [Pseudomonas fuscovaginae]